MTEWPHRVRRFVISTLFGILRDKSLNRLTLTDVVIPNVAPKTLMAFDINRFSKNYNTRRKCAIAMNDDVFI